MPRPIKSYIGENIAQNECVKIYTRFEGQKQYDYIFRSDKEKICTKESGF